MIPRLLVNSRMSYQSFANYVRSRTLNQVDYLAILAKVNQCFAQAAHAKRSRRFSLPSQTIKIEVLTENSVLARFFDWRYGSTPAGDIQPYMRLELLFSGEYMVRAEEYVPPVDPQKEYEELIETYFGELSRAQAHELYELGYLRLLANAHKHAESMRPVVKCEGAAYDSVREARARYFGAQQIVQDIVGVMRERVCKNTPIRHQGIKVTS